MQSAPHTIAAQRPAAGALRLSLPKAIDMKASRKLKQDLAQILKNDGNAVLDASSVQKVSAGCFQLLVAFRIAMATKARSVRYEAQSEFFEEAAKLLGLTGHLETEY